MHILWRVSIISSTYLCQTNYLMPVEKKIGIALSGGGYRATAFHLGTLRKLHEMKVLEKVQVISTISGGSIVGACYCSRDSGFENFYNDLYEGLQRKNVITKILFSWIGARFLFFILIFLGAFYFLFTPYPWLFPVIIAVWALVIFKYQFSLFPISKRIESIYNDFFYKNAVLGNLLEKPALVIGATNLQTAKSFIFSRSWMQDSSYQFLDDPVKFKAANFPLAKAVMASSCVPFAFTPVTIDREFFENPSDADKYHPILVDGGVYDNQGIHRVMQKGIFESDVVITSDAGCGSTGEMKFRNTFSLLMETVNVFMSRIKKGQMVRNVYDNAATANKQVAYFSLGWDVENCIPGFIKNLQKKQITQSVIQAHQLKDEWVSNPQQYEQEITTHLENRTGYQRIRKPTQEEKRIARNVGTNLTALSKQKVDCLIRQAEVLTELQVKLYCPSII